QRQQGDESQSQDADAEEGFEERPGGLFELHEDVQEQRDRDGGEGAGQELVAQVGHEAFHARDLTSRGRGRSPIIQSPKRKRGTRPDPHLRFGLCADASPTRAAHFFSPQTRTVWSLLQVTATRPSAEMATVRTSCVCPSSRRISLPVSTSQTRR